MLSLLLVGAEIDAGSVCCLALVLVDRIAATGAAVFLAISGPVGATEMLSPLSLKSPFSGPELSFSQYL